MTKPQVKIVNSETGEEIVRDMNADELAQLAIDKAAREAEAAVTASKAIAKSALLERLGITEDEAKLLLG
jgi:hypothetical protein